MAVVLLDQEGVGPSYQHHHHDADYQIIPETCQADQRVSENMTQAEMPAAAMEPKGCWG